MTMDERGRFDAWADTLMAWWYQANGASAPGWVKAERAELRRVHEVQAAVLTPAFQRLYGRLRAARSDDPLSGTHADAERLAATAALAAHVTSLSAHSMPEAMSQDPEHTGRLRVSELRFLRLLESPDIDALFRGLRRALPLVDHAVDLSSLAGDVYYWGDRTRKRWAYAYRWPDKTAV